MMNKEENEFYEIDSHQYDIAQNKILQKWLTDKTKEGYNPIINIDDMQHFIDDIVNWYEIKYPERELEFYEGIQYSDLKTVEPLSKNMNIEELLWRLPRKELLLLEAPYRSNGMAVRKKYNSNNKEIGYSYSIFVPIKEKNFIDNPYTTDDINSEFRIGADDKTGEVEYSYDLEDIIKGYDDNCYYTLESLLKELQTNYSEDLDLSALEKCIYNHKCDVELRDYLLKLVSLKLLYSERTIPERGAERGQRFINEFNKRLNLNINSLELRNVFKNNIIVIKDDISKQHSAKSLVKSLTKNNS